MHNKFPSLERYCDNLDHIVLYKEQSGQDLHCFVSIYWSTVDCGSSLNMYW